MDYEEIADDFLDTWYADINYGNTAGYFLAEYLPDEVTDF